MTINEYLGEDFRIALLCALPLEADAVTALFDRYWDENGQNYGKRSGDPNAYTTGQIGYHNVVLAHMPGIGKGIASSVASNLRSSYEGIQFALVVGTCGGVPYTEDEILLGDVVISEGIVQHDFGRRFPNTFVRKDALEENLGRPNADIRSFLAKMKGRIGRERLQEKTSHHLEFLKRKLGEEQAGYPGVTEDGLFSPSYRHKHHKLPTCELCNNCSGKDDPVCDSALRSTCKQLKCEDKMTIPRRRLGDIPKPAVHFGFFASGDTVMKSGQERDKIAKRERVIAFEMEGGRSFHQISDSMLESFMKQDVTNGKFWGCRYSTVF